MKKHEQEALEQEGWRFTNAELRAAFEENCTPGDYTRSLRALAEAAFQRGIGYAQAAHQDTKAHYEARLEQRDSEIAGLKGEIDELEGALARKQEECGPLARE